MKLPAKELLFTPIEGWRKDLVIVLVAVTFVFLPQNLPSDWKINTAAFWSDLSNPYGSRDVVYPPWGIILMLPYKLMQPAGARVLSVLVVGWLAARRQWSLSAFLAIVLAPYFVFTMQLCNMDILVYVLPILLWEASSGTRWQDLGRGVALSLLLLKPQGSLFIWPYLIYSSGATLKELTVPLLIVALVTVPVSLLGSPPFIVQWLDHVAHPSAQNIIYWSSNNVSLTTKFGLPSALLIVGIAATPLFLLVRQKKLIWTSDHTVSALLFSSMLLSPYASQQSVSSALAFVPSWGAAAVSVLGTIWGAGNPLYFDVLPLWVLFLAVASLLLHRPGSAPSSADRPLQERTDCGRAGR